MKKKLLTIAAPLLLLAFTAASALAQEGAQANGAKPAEGQEGGLLTLDIQSIAWVLAIFIVLAIILWRTAWTNVLVGLKAREARIRKDIADAEAARLEAEKILRDYNNKLAEASAKVQELFSKAITDAGALAAKIQADAETRAQERIERAQQEIEETKNQALTEIYDQTATLATSIAEKILRRNLNADDQRDLVNQSLEHLQKVGR